MMYITRLCEDGMYRDFECCDTGSLSDGRVHDTGCVYKRDVDDTGPLSDERLQQLTDLMRNGPEVVSMAKELLAWRMVLSVGTPSGRLKAEPKND